MQAMSYSNEPPPKKKNPKMRFILMFGHKIAKDYLRESIQQLKNDFGTVSKVTVWQKSNTDYLPQFTSPGRGRSTQNNKELFPSPKKMRARFFKT